MSMKMITDVTIDLYGEIQYYMASAKQGDKATRYLRIQLMNNGNEFQIPDDVVLIANIKKPDGKFCYNQCEKENNRVMVQLTSQALAAAGTAYCDIEMRDSDDKLILSSAAFSIEIEKSMRNEDAIESCNEITFLEKKIQQYIDSMLEVRKQVLSTEEAFKIAEAARVLAENGRVDAESLRRENETKRVVAEEIRQEHLLKMQGATKAAETAANRAETAADTAEKTEEAVKTAEAARVLAENGRVDAENLRRENETKRVAAEEIRQEHLNNKSNPHNVTKAQVGLGNVNNTSDVNKPVSTAQQNAIDAAYQQATGYTNQKIADLIGGAPETLDTLKEVADAIQTNKDVSAALDAAIGKKANQTELDTHTGNNTIHITSTERTNWNDANTKKHTHSNKSILDKITQALLDSWNAAYTHISDTVKHITAEERSKWNAAKIHADSAHARTDATKTEKSNTNGNIKINGTETNVYTHPNTAGNKHIPAGGSSGQILRWSADGTATWGSDNNTTYNNMTAATASAAGKAGLVPAPAAGKQASFLRGDGTWQVPTNTTYSTATQSANGLLSAADKKKLDGVATNANNYAHPTTAGNKHIPAGGSSGQILRWSADGTATWGSDNNTTYSTATQSANGLMSAADKKKLDGIAEEANKIIVDAVLAPTSTHPVQNKVLYDVFYKKIYPTFKTVSIIVQGSMISSDMTSDLPTGFDAEHTILVGWACNISSSSGIIYASNNVDYVKFISMTGTTFKWKGLTSGVIGSTITFLFCNFELLN